jgi:hypothetical protein
MVRRKTGLTRPTTGLVLDTEATANSAAEECRGGCGSEGEEALDMTSDMLPCFSPVRRSRLSGEKGQSMQAHDAALCANRFADSPGHDAASYTRPSSPAPSQDEIPAIFASAAEQLLAVTSAQERPRAQERTCAREARPKKAANWEKGQSVRPCVSRPGGRVTTLTIMQPAQLAVVLQGLPIAKLLMVSPPRLRQPTVCADTPTWPLAPARAQLRRRASLLVVANSRGHQSAN